MARSGEVLAGHERSEDDCHSSSEPSRKKRRTNQKELVRELSGLEIFCRECFLKRGLQHGATVSKSKMFVSAPQATIYHHAQTLLSDLAMLRGSKSDRAKPLIFIAHSLGGIVVKDALILSQNDPTHLKDILPTTVGVIILGTPHHGSKAASLGKFAFGTARVFFQNPNMHILRGLERNLEILERIIRSFVKFWLQDV